LHHETRLRQVFVVVIREPGGWGKRQQQTHGRYQQPDLFHSVLPVIFKAEHSVLRVPITLKKGRNRSKAFGNGNHSWLSERRDSGKTPTWLMKKTSCAKRRPCIRPKLRRRHAVRLARLVFFPMRLSGSYMGP
jgi:hypothetical protein